MRKKFDQEEAFAAALDVKALAQAVLAISEAMKKILGQSGGLNTKAIVLMIQAETGIAQKDIKAILEALPKLHKLYTNP